MFKFRIVNIFCKVYTSLINNATHMKLWTLKGGYIAIRGYPTFHTKIHPPPLPPLSNKKKNSFPLLLDRIHTRNTCLNKVFLYVVGHRLMVVFYRVAKPSDEMQKVVLIHAKAWNHCVHHSSQSHVRTAAFFFSGNWTYFSVASDGLLMATNLLSGVRDSSNDDSDCMII